jgi:hypothetical protein
MIKLKDLLFESTAPDIFVPRRMEDRVERMISLYIRNGNKGNLVLRLMNLTELPAILKNVSVGGTFDCSNNKLISLINAPKSVVISFYCGTNHLTSLEGAPTNVGISFYCGNNELTSLEFAPTSVGRNFDCSHNELTSLEFAPKTVGGFFDCRYNPVKFTEKQVRAVCNVKGDVYV